MRKIPKLLVATTILTFSGCGGDSGGGAGNTPTPTNLQVTPPVVSTTPVTITAINAANLGKRAYFALISYYYLTSSDIGNKTYATQQGNTTTACTTSGSSTESWSVANIDSYARVAGDVFGFSYDACRNSGDAVSYGSLTYTVNSSYDARGEKNSSYCNPTCTIDETIRLSDRISDVSLRAGIEGTFSKNITVDSGGSKSITLDTSNFYFSSLDDTTGSQYIDYSVASQYNATTGEYSGTATASIAIASADLNGVLNIDASYTSDADFWFFASSATATTTSATITVTGANNSKVVVSVSDTTYTVEVDVDGDGNFDGAPIVLSQAAFIQS